MGRNWGPSRSEWLRPEAYDALSPAEKRALWAGQNRQRRRSRLAQGLLLASLAIVMGLIVGFAWSRGGGTVQTAPGAPIEWNEVQPVPEALPDPQDSDWSRRGEVDDAGSSGSGQNEAIRASFGLCFTGGGRNCVVDGDTFWIGGEKVRIAGIDAPETHPSRCPQEAALGSQATTMLRDLLNGGAITLTRIDRDRDSYGRLLRNVAVDGQDVGEAMIAAGVAREYGGGRQPWC